MKELNDNETGLYYLKSRYYNPELGRFISADAVVGKTGEILSHNLLSYCANNPVNAIDEDGNRFEWIKSKWNAAKKAVSTGVKKVVSGAKRVAARVVSGVKKAVRSASTWVRNKYRGYTNTAKNTYRRTKKWVHNTARTVSRKAQNVSHSVVKHTRNFVNNHRRAIEITRNIVTIASIALIAIPLVAPVAIPAMAIAALGIVEFGLDLAVGDNTSAAADLLCLFPMGKGFKYVTEIGGDAIKGGSKAKNLYKAEGLLEMNLQKFGKGAGKAGTVWGNIEITQRIYEGTKIQKSFKLSVGDKKFWVHPNGAKHMLEYITKDATSHGMPMNSQALLSSFENAVADAAKKGVKYDEIMNEGNWELIFSKPCGDGLLPVIKHAVYRP
ncbi:RHS repeat domain-containing protein [Clostridium botulinum]|uniref:RHS repeat domain-containing protein n=1 Tax=Clostridium botulinum TaxID=1491 RepID=UPI003DA2AF0F